MNEGTKNKHDGKNNAGREEDIFWLGGAPGTRKQPGEPSGHLADRSEFTAAITRCAESAGCTVKQFVSAKGPYGTWLIVYRRAGRAQRILWNGREQRLVLQLELPNGGWEDPISIEVASQDQTGFVAGVEQILQTDPADCA